MEWTKEKVHDLVVKQREYFLTGVTQPIKWRINQLKKLKAGIIKHTPAICEALKKDLGRSESEAYILDVGDVIMEVNECIHHLRRWARPETHYSGLVCFPSVKTKVYKKPYGVSLIVAPFNFPVLLSIGVLAASISGGNTAIIKMSSKTVATTQALIDMIADTFGPEYAIVVDGGHDVADWCLEERFDKIFYTGSPNVAVHVMEEAAKNLTPVALELGGENGNWAVVRKDADLADAARKIAFFKIMNSGQVCINVNQVAVAKEVADQFVEELKKAITTQIGEHASQNPEYCKLIGKKAYEACANEAKEYQDRIVFGGKGDPETLKFDTTIIYPVKIDEKIVNHELFCPLLPVVPFDDDKIDELIEVIERREHPLAMYVFTSNKRWAKKVMSTSQFGGGCINEVCLQIMVKGVPFNGTGHSGMGAYHGVWGFREFTHPSTVMFGCKHLNLPLREHPYSKKFLGFKKKDILKVMMK